MSRHPDWPRAALAACSLAVCLHAAPASADEAPTIIFEATPPPLPQPTPAPTPAPTPTRSALPSVFFRPWASDWRQPISIEVNGRQCPRLPCHIELAPGTYPVTVRSNGVIDEEPELVVDAATRSVRVRPRRSGQVASVWAASTGGTLLLAGIILASVRNQPSYYYGTSGVDNAAYQATGGVFIVAGLAMFLSALPNAVRRTMRLETEEFAQVSPPSSSLRLRSVGLAALTGGGAVGATFTF